MGVMAPQQKTEVSPNVKMKMNEEEGPGGGRRYTQELVESWLEAFVVNMPIQQSQEKQCNFLFLSQILARCTAAVSDHQCNIFVIMMWL